jgi:hypothetical protein
LLFTRANTSTLRSSVLLIAVPVDKTLHDGDPVMLGDTTLLV